MLSKGSRRKGANETDLEVGIRRSPARPYTGTGVSARFSEDQLPGFVHRVRMLAHLSGLSYESICDQRGIYCEARAQVLAALEAE